MSEYYTGSTSSYHINSYYCDKRFTPKIDFETQFRGDFERQLNQDVKEKSKEVLLFDPENLVL